jgi:hypothetical protein
MAKLRLKSILAAGACALLLGGCATLGEWGKGFLGISTKVLEDKRAEAIKKSFNYDYASCYGKVKEALKEIGAYIYAEDKQQQLIAIYVSEEDTTPVGLFLTQEGQLTRVEVSSPSKSAKELIARRVFRRLEGINEPEEEAAAP